MDMSSEKPKKSKQQELIKIVMLNLKILLYSIHSIENQAIKLLVLTLKRKRF